MALYPLWIIVERNLKQSIAPVPKAKVFVYQSAAGGAQKPLYPDAIGAPGSMIDQPIEVDANGEILVYTTPGRTRVDMQIDPFLTKSIELVIPDDDNIITPIRGEEPSGTPDGVLTSFALSRTPLGGKAALYVDGLRWRQVDLNVAPFGREFNVEGAVLTLGDPPLTGAVLLVDYTPVKV